jgi:hypothetical protein
MELRMNLEHKNRGENTVHKHLQVWNVPNCKLPTIYLEWYWKHGLQKNASLEFVAMHMKQLLQVWNVLPWS